MFSDNPDIRYLQEHELQLLKYFDEICSKNSLRYFICGGTLLGAVREKGFIAWDDDVDVMMPREDYEWLLRNRNLLFNDTYYLYDYKVDTYKDNPRRVPAIVDKTIKLRMKRSSKAREQYLTLDVFVLDGMPKTRIGRMLHYYHFMFWHMLLQLSWYDEQVNQHRLNRAFIEKVVICLLNTIKIRPNLDSKWLVQKENEILSKYKWNHGDYVCSLLGPEKKKEILPKYIFDNTIKLKFEDTEFCAPQGYHFELKHYYGDYMSPPKTIEERELHHRFEIVGLER